MEDQTPKDPPRGRRTRSESGTRPRPAAAAFTPPPTPAQRDKPAPEDGSPGTEKPRGRRAKAAPPAVLFQPPAADEAPTTQPAATEPPPATGAATSRKTTGARKVAPARKTTPVKKAASTRKATPIQSSDSPAETSTSIPGPETPTVNSGVPVPVAQESIAPPAKRAARKATKRSTPQKAAEPPAAVSGGDAPEARQPTLLASEIVEPATGRTRQVLARLLDHPGYAPELLALAAVETLGPQARDWVRRNRADYPAASPDGLARLATQRFVRFGATGGALAAASGLFAPITELAAIAWVQAGLALHLAACYDQDPTDPDRAVDLLVLTQVHPDDASARAALDAARTAGPEEELALHKVAEAGWRLAAPLAAQTGGWLALRLLGRVLPGAVPLAVVAGGSAAAQRLAARAITRYRSARHRPIPAPGAMSGADSPVGEPSSAQSQSNQSRGSSA